MQTSDNSAQQVQSKQTGKQVSVQTNRKSFPVTVFLKAGDHKKKTSKMNELGYSLLMYGTSKIKNIPKTRILKSYIFPRC